jgi:hypothetical protein
MCSSALGCRWFLKRSLALDHHRSYWDRVALKQHLRKIAEIWRSGGCLKNMARDRPGERFQS